ncbi:exonuclease domain-containing protein, partial [Paracoccaceae bacterium]|nr:exonuclease domain-containing protein [Paracoccaceae bacterium]
NASFDMRFLNAELSWVKRPQIPLERALDTLAIARKKFPGSPASLDALCRRFGIDNNARTLHGALLDSEILAEVYLELIGGRQPDFMLSAQATTATEHAGTDRHVSGSKQRLKPLAPRVSDAEKKAHLEMVATLGDQAMWRDHIWKEQT